MFVRYGIWKPNLRSTPAVVNVAMVLRVVVSMLLSAVSGVVETFHYGTMT